MRESICWYCNKSSNSKLCTWVAYFKMAPGTVAKGNTIFECPNFDGKIPTAKTKTKTKIKKTCIHCGMEFLAEHGYQKFCSHQCSLLHRNEKNRVERKCIICGKKFIGTPKQKYCSPKCSKKSRALQKSEYNRKRKQKTV